MNKVIIIMKIIRIKINKCENWNFGYWESNLKIEKLEFRKLGIKFGNRNFEKLFKDGILKNK